MSLHASGSAFGPAIHEADFPGAATAPGPRDEPRRRGSPGASRAATHDRSEWAPGSAATNAADPGPEYLSNELNGCRAPAALSGFRCPTAAAVLDVDSKSTESDAVYGLQEESVIRHILGRNLGRISESDYGDTIDWLVVGNDSADAYAGLDGAAGCSASDNHAVGEEYAGPEACSSDRDCAGGADAGGKLGGAAAAALVRQLHPTEAIADAAQLPTGAQAVVAGLHAARPARDPARRPHHRAAELCDHDAGPRRPARHAPDSSTALWKSERQHNDGKLAPFTVA